jgi:TrmH family RNA methyltransferase
VRSVVVELSDARSKLVRRLHRRKTRERESLVLVEGPRAGDEALAAGASVRFAVTSPRLQALGGESVVVGLAAAGVDVHEVDDRELAELADTESPQGLLLVVEQPAPAWFPKLPDGRWLVLDALQDPGNVGTLIRAAAAFECAGVVALGGTADPWGTKAVRAAAGACFRLPIHVARGRDLGEVTAALPRPILLADMVGDVPSEQCGPRWSLVVGNEGSGIRDALGVEADARVAIPMPGGIESLNAGVAGAILLYALSQPAPHRRP